MESLARLAKSLLLSSSNGLVSLHSRPNSMKNFPHQINQLPRLRRALQVFVRLIDARESVIDDGVVGDALADAGVYTFRNAGDRSTDELLRAEHRKPVARLPRAVRLLAARRRGSVQSR